MTPVQIHKLTETARLPEKATSGSAGYDLRADESCKLFAGEVKAIKTGLIMEIPFGYECQIRSRSGLALKNHVFVPNSPGTIDSDFRNEIKVLLYNAGPHTFDISIGDRIAQCIFAVVESPVMNIAESPLSQTERTGGFGSTGIC